MFDFLRPVFIYVRMSRDKIEMRNLSTGRGSERIASKKFSNERLIIADFINAEIEMRRLLRELLPGRILPPTIKMLFQPVDESITEITPVEKRVYLDSCEHAGAKQVIVYDDQNRLSDKEALELLKGMTNSNKT